MRQRSILAMALLGACSSSEQVDCSWSARPNMQDLLFGIVATRDARVAVGSQGTIVRDDGSGWAVEHYGDNEAWFTGTLASSDGDAVWAWEPEGVSAWTPNANWETLHRMPGQHRIGDATRADPANLALTTVWPDCDDCEALPGSQRLWTLDDTGGQTFEALETAPVLFGAVAADATQTALVAADGTLWTREDVAPWRQEQLQGGQLIDAEYLDGELHILWMDRIVRGPDFEPLLVEDDGAFWDFWSSGSGDLWLLHRSASGAFSLRHHDGLSWTTLPIPAELTILRGYADTAGTLGIAFDEAVSLVDLEADFAPVWSEIRFERPIAVEMVSADEAYMIAQARVIGRWDGASWSLHREGAGGDGLEDLWAMPGAAIAVGEGAILHLSDDRIEVLDPGPSDGSFRLLWAVDGRSASDFYVVGSAIGASEEYQEVIFGHFDGSTLERLEPPPTATHLTDVLVRDARLYVLGSDDEEAVLWEYMNGAWMTRASSPQSLGRLHALDDGTVLVAVPFDRDDGVGILELQETGWEPFPGAAGATYSLSGVTRTSLFRSVEDGDLTRIEHFDGATWQATTTATARAIAGSFGESVLVVGEDGTTYGLCSAD